MKVLNFVFTVGWLWCGGLLARGAFSDFQPSQSVMLVGAMACLLRVIRMIVESAPDEGGVR